MAQASNSGSRVPQMDITGIRFSMFSDEQMRAMSVCTVTISKLEDSKAYAGEGTLYDKRMGPITATDPCPTCKQVLVRCFGHFGKIEFPLPVPQPLFGDKLVRILSCFCNYMIKDETDPTGYRMCMAPLFSNELLAEYTNIRPSDKLAIIAKSTHKVCSYKRAGVTHTQGEWAYFRPKDTRQGAHSFFRVLLNGKIVPTADLLRWTGLIKLRDMKKLGLSITPDKLIRNLVLVLPNPERLPVGGEGSNHSPHHDFTRAFGNVVEASNVLRAKKEAKEKNKESIDELYEDPAYEQLCTELYHLFVSKDNTCRENATNMKSTSAMFDNIDGKLGIFRNDVFAGRGPHTARSVIVPDSNIGSNEVGVPEIIMDTLTKNMEVTTHNLPLIKKLAEQGKIISIKSNEGGRISNIPLDQRLEQNIPDNVQEYRLLVGLNSNKDGELTIDRDELAIRLDITPAQLEQLEKIDLQLKLEDENRKERIKSLIASIKPGQTVTRTLIDGDLVLMSRQPLLRKESCMGHRARRVPGKAYRLNGNIVSPYNADFDGDQMNMYVPQTYQEEAEVLGLMSVDRCGVSEQGNKPLISLIQDALLGLALLTSTTKKVVKAEELPEGHPMLDDIEKEDEKRKERMKGLKKDDKKRKEIESKMGTIEITVDFVPEVDSGLWMTCAMKAKRADILIKIDKKTGRVINEQTAKELGEENVEVITMIERHKQRCERVKLFRYSGRALASLLFDGDYEYHGKSNFGPVSIINGIVYGTFDSKILGTASNSIYHDLFLRKGSKVAIEFLTNAQLLVQSWMQHYGFTISYRDISICREGREEIKKERQILIDNVMKIRRGGTESGPFIERESEAERERIEADVTNASNNILQQLAPTVLKWVDRNQPLRLMADFGTKGSNISLTQFFGFVGQITIQQRLPERTLSDRRRLDTHFAEDDPDPAGFGMCKTSYNEGIEPSGIFAQGAATHQAAYDIAANTGRAGYTQRRLAFCLFNILVFPDGSARIPSSTDKKDTLIIQLLTGGDGLDGKRLIRNQGRNRPINVYNIVKQCQLDLQLAKSEEKGIILPEVTRVFLNRFDEVKLLQERARLLQLNAKPYPISNGAALPASEVLIAAQELEGGYLDATKLARLGTTVKQVLLEPAISTESSIRV